MKTINKKHLLFLLLLWNGVSLLFAQTNEVRVTVVVPPPYSSRLEDYSTLEGRAIITLQNTGSRNLQVKLKGALSGDNGIRIFTKDEYEPPRAINLSVGEIKVLSGSDIEGFFSEESIGAVGITREELLRNRVIPEGNYSFCITAYDFTQAGYNEAGRISDGEPAGCASFPITFLEPPIITRIGTGVCGDVLSESNILNPQALILQWSRPAGAGAEIRYRVTIAEVIPETRDLNDAINSSTSPPFFQEDVVGANILVYDASKPPLRRGFKYAIRVQAIETRNTYRNRGYSEVCGFTYGTGTGSGGSGSLRLTQVYPEEGSIIPWQAFPVIVKFEPYNDDYVEFNSNYTLSSGGATLETNNRSLRWPNGPLVSQRRVTGFAEMTQDQSQHIAVNRLPGDGAAASYFRGRNNATQISVTMDVSGTSRDENGSVNANFKVGMPMPMLNTPNDGESFPPGRIDFNFTTGERPTRLLPPFSIVQAARRSGVSFFNGNIQERFLFQVSKDRDFTTILDTFSRTVGRNFDLNTDDEEAIARDLYKNIDVNKSYRDTGWYYWRVIWLQTPSILDTRNSYNHSLIRRFRISNGTIAPRDSVRRTPPDCLASCNAPDLTNRTLRTGSLAVRDNFKLGRFDCEVTRISSASSPYSGEAVVLVPFLNSRIKVTFTGLTLNTDNRAVSGTAASIVDIPAAISADMARTGASFVGMTDAQGQEINRLAGNIERTVSRLLPTNSPIGMPLGLDNVIGGQRYTIAIVGMNFSATTASLNAVFSLDIPELHGWLSLGAADICFHPGGLSMGRGILYNPIEKVIPFSDDIQMVFNRSDFPRDSGTYVSWDCQGFKALHLKGEFRFSRNWFLPDSVTGDAASGKVKATFHATVVRRGNWMLELGMNPFQVNGLPEWGFAARGMAFDFSDLGNPESMRFPAGYTGETGNSWRGFYMRELEVRLPKKFKTFNEPERRLTFGAYHMLIDRTGFSGKIQGRNIVSVRDGNLDGWGFSLDTVGLEFVSNSFRNAGVSGGVKLPIAQRPVSYRMNLTRSATGEFGYQCVIQPQDTLSASLWAAQLRLNPTSNIRITVDRRGFRARAQLDGQISISGNIAPIGQTNFVGMTFNEFVVESVAPYISIRSLSFTSPPKQAGGFPVNIDNFSLVVRDGPGTTESDRRPGTRVGLGFRLGVVLTGESNVFGASTDLEFVGRLEGGVTNPQGWTFTGINCNGVSINGNVGVVELRGGLQFYNGNATYGDGIRGYITATFKPTITLQAIVQFGSLRGHRYWYVDASARFTPGLTVFPGFALTGFGGAAYYGMTLSDLPPANRISAGAAPDISTIGATSSGGRVTPNESMGFGFLAKLYMGAPAGNAYKAMVEFGADFNRTGGISTMRINGDLILMSETDNVREAQVGAEMRMSYDFNANIFDGRFNIFINVAGGIVRGRNPGNIAGEIHIYAAPDRWWFKIGSPENRVGVAIDLRALRLDVNSYLMCGSHLPGIPPMPPEVLAMCPGAARPAERDPRLATGAGFAFGAALDFNLNANFLIFYARLQLIIGFDINIRKNEGITCAGLPPGTYRGVDGWYAEGQLYAYFAGSIGIEVNLWFVQGRFEILSVRAGAAVRGGFPNPNWIKGYCGGEYSILGGLISGRVNFEVSIGEECTAPVENPLGDVELITQLSPGDGERNVDCGVNPQAVFNIVPEQIQTLRYTESNGRELVKTFRVRYKNYNLTGGAINISQILVGGTASGATIHRSADGYNFTMIPIDYLPQLTDFRLQITAYIEERQADGTWRAARLNNGNLVEKTYVSNFRTGPYPQTIRDQDILYTYPYRNQRYLLHRECREGVIQLRAGMSFLFNRQRIGYTYDYYAEMLPIDGSAEPIRLEINRGSTSNFISFQIPDLNNEKVYAVRVIAAEIPNVAMTNISGGLGRRTLPRAALGTALSQTNYQNIITSNISLTRYVTGSTNVNVRNNRIDATRVKSNQKIMYIYYFRTSKYNTLAEKMRTVNTAVASQIPLFDEGNGMIYRLRMRISTDEAFDKYDASGESYEFPRGNPTLRTTGALVSFTDQGGSYTTFNIRNAIYDKYRTASWSHRLINSTRTFGFLSVTMPQTRYPLAESYVAFLDYDNCRNIMDPSEYLPQPASTGGFNFNALGGSLLALNSFSGARGSSPQLPSGFSGYTPPVNTFSFINSTVYMDAHRHKTELANTIQRLQGGSYPLILLSTTLTTEQRAWYNNPAFWRRFYYPACQNITYTGFFNFPVHCQVPDSPNVGTRKPFTFLYPSTVNCNDIPR